MKLSVVCFTCAALLYGTNLPAQVREFPYVEKFDSVGTPFLPEGWTTTTNRIPAGDFFSTTTSPRSSPYALQSTNSTIAQSLISPIFDFSGRIPGELRFWTARSGTYTSPLLVEASVDGGTTFSAIFSDTLHHPGTNSYAETIITLPESLAFQPAVRIRWRLLGEKGGTSGTFRIDDISLTVLTSHDLSADHMTVSPPNPTGNSTLTIMATCRNRGALASSEYSLNLFLDSDGDDRANATEQIATMPGTPLAPGDSVIFSFLFDPLPQGEHRFIAVVDFQKDEDPTNDTTSADITVGVPPGSIVVNEFLYAPKGDEPEWVELYNTSMDTVNLRNWRISDSNTSSRTRITGLDLFVHPRSYALIAKDTSFISAHPDVSVPTAFAGFSALNNTTDDAVVIFDERQISMDSVHYFPHWGGQNGTSLERVDAFSGSTDSRNWSSSIDSAGSTPGRANSIVRLDMDLAVGGTEVSGFLLYVIVTNNGRFDVNAFQIRLFADDNNNDVPEPEELIEVLPSSGVLPARGSAFFSYDWSAFPSGETRLIIVIDLPLDQQLSNNTAVVTLLQQYPRNALVINEIMYEPLSGFGEWVELYNASLSPVDIQGWTLADGAAGSPSFVISPSPASVESGGFAVISSDSSLLSFRSSDSSAGFFILNRSGGFGLGNEGDIIVIRGATGETIDSVSYLPSWHIPSLSQTRGHSLERINPGFPSNDQGNWSTSAAPWGATPGVRNSIYTVRRFPAAALSFSPNPFSPDHDGFEDFCLITYRLPASSAFVRMLIFDLQGRLIRTLVSSRLSGNEGEVLWDGRDSEGRQARIGPHVLLLEAVDGNGGTVASMKGVIVVATKL